MVVVVRRKEFGILHGVDHPSAARHSLQGPVIVHGWPKEIKAFYMRCNDDERTVAAMDILFPRAGEMAGGSQVCVCVYVCGSESATTKRLLVV